jgi:hypothetical protein
MLSALVVTAVVAVLLALAATTIMAIMLMLAAGPALAKDRSSVSRSNRYRPSGQLLSIR